MLKTLTLACSLLALAACGSDDNGDDNGVTLDATVSIDAATGTSNLGALCGGSQPNCPTDEVCVVQPVQNGSATEGYCSPMCSVDTECTDGYTQPGTPVCFSMNRCTIVCTNVGATTAECPAGLTCLATGGPTNVCAVQM